MPRGTTIVRSAERTAANATAVAARATTTRANVSSMISSLTSARDIAVTKARPWRRLARAGVYDAHLATDDRSDDRGAF